MVRLGSEFACQCRRHMRGRFNPWVRKIPCRRKWQPTTVILPGKFHGQKSLAGYSLRGHKRIENDWVHAESQLRQKRKNKNKKGVRWAIDDLVSNVSASLKPWIFIDCTIPKDITRGLQYNICSWKLTVSKSPLVSMQSLQTLPNLYLITILLAGQSLSCVRLFATPWTAEHQASLSFTISESAQIHVHWVSDAI